MPSTLAIADTTARLVAGMHIGLGAYSTLNPRAGAVNGGFIPATAASTPEIALLLPAIGARQIGVGVSMLVFSLQRSRHAVGVVAACSMIAKIVDCWACYSQRALGSDWKRHMLGLLMDGALAWTLVEWRP